MRTLSFAGHLPERRGEKEDSGGWAGELKRYTAQ